ncbi:MAG: radical SAM protein [Mariniblastus sp.]|nr:radical SAM protein [Mariniblastus sp.]
MHFKCNLKCEHCMIEGTMDWLQPESAENFEKLLEQNAREQKWQGIILTGSEVTLRKDLPDLARMARQHGFDHVRIQTHGMRLANLDYCHELIEAGIDEYFVSVTAADAETHDRITEVPGSFDKTVRGLENLDQFESVKTLTNTVITARSYKHLPAMVELFSHLKRLVQMDFWTYWPMSENDDKNLIVSHMDTLPYLVEAIHLARVYDRAFELKNFPECLLGDLREALDNNQPKLFIDPEFWPEFMRNGFHQCVYKEACSSTQCLGLNTAYTKKFGWMEDVLTPYPSDESVDVTSNP